MEQRKAHRIVFERGFAANMMAIDGTWQRPCTMEDVSDTGARLAVDGSVGPDNGHAATTAACPFGARLDSCIAAETAPTYYGTAPLSARVLNHINLGNP